MNAKHFHIPGDATKREYAIYVMVAQHRETKDVLLYIGKTGDNREGCNPVISRAGNHFSFNKIHSQMRNKLSADPENYNYDFFYTTFGEYIDPKISREHIDVINEMERRANLLVQNAAIGKVLNPYNGKYVQRQKRIAREALVTPERVQKLRELIAEVNNFVAKISE